MAFMGLGGQALGFQGQGLSLGLQGPGALYIQIFIIYFYMLSICIWTCIECCCMCCVATPRDCERT